MEKLVIFTSNNNAVYVVKVSNWDENVNSIVYKARHKRTANTDRLFGIIVEELRSAGYDVSPVEQDISLYKI